ncbi:MAG TPA: polyphosphate kinase 1 [Firmicutes bacterium]|nr:polyphosphate kinase 1 [Bacillota bacterium]
MKLTVPQKIKKKFIRDIYVNREYSWLLFNKRVLDQSVDLTNPLLERCKFLSIFTSNLDEFFMVRVGSLYNESISEPQATENKTRLTSAKQLDGIADVVQKLYEMRAVCYSALRKDLGKNGLRILRAEDLTPRQTEECRQIFLRHVLPLLSLMVLDAKHPLMQFENKRSYMICQLEKDGRRMIGVISVNPSLDRLYRLSGEKKVRLIPLEELVRMFGKLAFTGYTVNEQMLMRVTRNADFDTHIDDSDVERDFSEIMKKKVESRAKLNVVRLEMDNAESKLKEFVLKLLNLNPKFCFCDERFFDYKFLFSLGNYFSAEQSAPLKYAPFKGAVSDELSMAPSLIDTVFRHDVFLSYPYDAMTPVVDLLEECAKDKRVSSIMITIYRLAHHSRIAELLCRASENGKQVVVVIELCARFDEENNMYFASKLQEAGCTIIYGMDNYKVHSKIISVVLKEGEQLRYITHLGTGNYNESTSRQYTDLNIITADRKIGEDAVAFFRNVSICNTDFEYERLLVAPKTLKSGLIGYMDREIEKAKRGEEGYILAKMNSLTDKEIIDKFAEASAAGVKIELVIRGICCLLPGVPEKTENIRVVSIVGRFLEHSRVYSFGRGEDRVTYISSADLMTRNTDKRVEIAAPVLDSRIADRIVGILQTMLADNVKARKLCPDGEYRKVETLGEPLDAQAYFLNEASRQ